MANRFHENMAISAKLRNWRSRGFTDLDIAKKLKLSQRQAFMLENRSYDLPSSERWILLDATDNDEVASGSLCYYNS